MQLAIVRIVHFDDHVEDRTRRHAGRETASRARAASRTARRARPEWSMEVFAPGLMKEGYGQETQCHVRRIGDPMPLAQFSRAPTGPPGCRDSGKTHRWRSQTPPQSWREDGHGSPRPPTRPPRRPMARAVTDESVRTASALPLEGVALVRHVARRRLESGHRAHPVRRRPVHGKSRPDLRNTRPPQHTCKCGKSRPDPCNTPRPDPYTSAATPQQCGVVQSGRDCGQTMPAKWTAVTRAARARLIMTVRCLPAISALWAASPPLIKRRGSRVLFGPGPIPFLSAQ